MTQNKKPVALVAIVLIVLMVLPVIVLMVSKGGDSAAGNGANISIPTGEH